ncbi:DUF2264 domain-containing protein [Flavobacterium circumlabens]|uniref:DUF2264 domain-containing protein n=1 Tax=Flavobacterium circumlabens TaxID=2133765 RepID=A0A4Y7UDA7_9FLAO|nr:DUF2264 domain-containing protein [Flavobacterium circumlabens]TCN59038.1 uncharacterized protein DUF2264 [Flavobacterium circumlabens]TEB44433.1 DUF2264 domain-containing protein [Flavobacterium circumlabens]
MTIDLLRKPLLLVALFYSANMIAQQNVINSHQVVSEKSQVFQIKNPDNLLSPYTGMTREHWKDAGLYLLKGAFSYIKTLDDPMLFPKQEGKSYPRDGKDSETEMLEGLCRTMFIAAPLLKENPSLKINNISVADYYRHQIEKLTDPTSATFIKRREGNYSSQNLVEFGALSICLFAAPDVLWKPLSQEKKDALAITMLSYGDGPTVDSNWKFFNIFVLSFFKSEGYAMDETLLEGYLKKSLAHYRGDGWYNDAPCYDYYSMWAFQMYGSIWSEYFGKKYYPEFAAQFKTNFKDLKNNYPYMFSRDGEMIMWGRSITYRFGSISPFPLMGFENDPQTNYGWMRRISSGVLLQFLKNPNLLKDNVPTLGFYGEFEPAVQRYSCRGSAFWMAKAFLGLLVPAENPFWTATENDGAWENELIKGKVYNKFSEKSEVLITDYPNIGAAEIRAWSSAIKGTGDPNDFYRSNENYNRLAYNSAFPWQADGVNGEVAMNYVFKNNTQKWEAVTLYTFKKFENGIYYRDVVLESDAAISMRLADITLPNGILRVDKNVSTKTVDLRLGHYSLPVVKNKIKRSNRAINGYNVQIIDNGVYQLAMIPISGWGNSMEVIDTKGLNPVSNESSIINVSDKFVTTKNPLYITLMLWKKSGEKWTNNELVPIKNLTVSNDNNNVSFDIIGGDKKTVSFN